MSARLTDVERAERKMSELDLQRLLVSTKPPGLAVMLGWEHVHVRPGMRAGGQWRTATSGSMAAGWPDLVLVRARDRRLIFAELKRELEQPSSEQVRVLDVLRSLADGIDEIATNNAIARGGYGAKVRQIEVHVWRPSDLRDPIDESVIGRILR